MATSLQILKSSVLTPVSMSQSKLLRKSDGGKVILQFRSHRRSRSFARKRLRVCCGVQEGDNKSNGEEPPESLFMKELRRRGMTPTSLLEDTKRTDYEPDVERNLREEDRGFSNRNAVSELDKSLSNQRERSMALNSEGLEHKTIKLPIFLTLSPNGKMHFEVKLFREESMLKDLYREQKVLLNERELAGRSFSMLSRLTLEELIELLFHFSSNQLFV